MVHITIVAITIIIITTTHWPTSTQSQSNSSSFFRTVCICAHINVSITMHAAVCSIPVIGTVVSVGYGVCLYLELGEHCPPPHSPHPPSLLPLFSTPQLIRCGIVITAAKPRWPLTSTQHAGSDTKRFTENTVTALGLQNQSSIQFSSRQSK